MHNINIFAYNKIQHLWRIKNMEIKKVNKYIKILSINNINIVFYKDTINIIYNTIDKIIYTTQTNINKSSIKEYIQSYIPDYKILFIDNMNSIKLNINYHNINQ